MKSITPILLVAFTGFLFGCKKEVKQTSPPRPSVQLEQLDKMLSSIAEKPQYFSVSSNKTSTVKGAKGTVIHVNPSQLESINGSPLADNIQIELLELKNKADMLLQNVQTVSGDRMLETGGAYYLNITSNGNQLKMKEGKGMAVEFPQQTEDEMDLYLGERDSLHQMNWTQTTEKFQPKPNRSKVDDTIHGSSGENTAKSPTNIKPPTKPLQADGQDNRVLTIAIDEIRATPELQQYNNVSFRVNDDCNYDPNDADLYWYDVSISRSSVEGEYIVVFKGLDKKSKSITKKYEVTPVLEGEDYQEALRQFEVKYKEYERLKKENPVKVENEIAALVNRQEEINLRNATYQAIKLTNFGWINVDKLLDEKGPKTKLEFFVNNDSLSAARIYAVFKDINCIVTSYYVKGQELPSVLKNIPTGKQLAIIALSEHNTTPYIFESEINTNTDRTVQINFAATTLEEIQEKMKNMN